MKRDEYKKGILIFSVCLAAFLCCMGIILYSYLRDEIQSQKRQITQMIGSMEKGDTKEKAISDLLKGVDDSSDVKEGNRVLRQYGYTKDYQSVFDVWLRQQQIGIITGILGSFFCISILIAGLLYYLKSMKAKETKQFQQILENFRDENYFVPYVEKEGSESRLYSQMDSLGKQLMIRQNQWNREKEDTKSLVTNISHQIKTPLAALKMCMDLLEDQGLSKEEKTEFMTRSREQVEHLELLAASLFQISRMEAGMIQIHPERTKIIDTLIQAVNAVYLKAEEKDISIELKVQEEERFQSLFLWHDPKWTKEALVNVLENAVKYSPENTKIQIVVLFRTNFLRIEVRDHGIGIPQKEYHKIFQRFYRGRSKEVAKQEGAGVGLYLTRKILEEQGGSIMATSGEYGSTLILHLSLTKV